MGAADPALDALAERFAELLLSRTRRAARRRTAFHESGHAVAAVVLRRGLGRVTIDPDNVSAGHTDIGPLFRRPPTALAAAPLTARDRRRIENLIVVIFAGIAAETLDESGLEDIGERADNDFEHAANLLRLLRHYRPSEDVKVVLGRLVERASRIVDEHAHAVTAVAEALLERGALTGREVRTMVASAS